MKFAGIIFLVVMSTVFTFGQATSGVTPDQIEKASKILIKNGNLAGEPVNSMTEPLRQALRKYQADKKLTVNGWLNTQTLVAMKIDLTDSQKETREQLLKIQNLLKKADFYNVEPNGLLDDITRIGLQKYQLANDLRITGTINSETLKKMGLPPTEEQKKRFAGRFN